MLGVIERAEDDVVRGERIGFVLAGAFGPDITLEVQRYVRDQVAEQRKRDQGLADQLRGLTRIESHLTLRGRHDRVSPLSPAAFRELDQQLLLGREVATYARSVQAGSVGHGRDRDKPDTTHFRMVLLP